MQLTPAGGARERRMPSLTIGRRASQQCWGVTAGKPRHNSINVRGVTAGKVRRNSSINNHVITSLVCLFQSSVHNQTITFG